RLEVTTLVEVYPVNEIRKFAGTAAGTNIYAGLRRIACNVFAVVIVVGIDIPSKCRLAFVIRIIRIKAGQRIGVFVYYFLRKRNVGNAIVGGRFISQTHILQRMKTLRFAGKRGKTLFSVDRELRFSYGTAF